MSEVGLEGSIGQFLKQCERSGDAAYAAFRSLLEKLEDPTTRISARVFLGLLRNHFISDNQASNQCFNTYHFRIEDVIIDYLNGYNRRNKLSMMVIPSIFMPEDWSFTFYEGLNRIPDSVFKDRTVAELGCGNGWISIAIAEKWSPSKVYGLDINPRAIKISLLNLYLNALDDDGKPIYDGEKKTLLDRVEFHESDLLAYCREHDIKLERIIGCIPQILNPNPDAMSKMITENASEEFLHSLSNYCALQGFVEDQFGLGLIARAVEEGIAVIQPLGYMIFNIGGRPGQAVCERLFKRRGLDIKKLWQKKIIQAADTDISALVEIEKNSPHRFEFFMGLVENQPICARTAWAYGKAGGSISHAISVYSCQLRHPNQVKTIFEFLKNGFHDIGSSLDLSFEDDSVGEEKIPFLSYFANVLKMRSFFPYEPPAGSKQFRDQISGFMRIYHHIPLTADNIVVFPSRAAAIESALRLFSPRLAIVDERLTRNLPKQWLTSLNDDSEDVVTVIEAPCQSDLMIQLIKKLKPQVVVTGMAQFEAITTSAFQQLLDTTRDIGSRLFLDISDHFELSSLPNSNGVLKFLAGTRLPSHAAIICGLLKNRVYSDLEVAFIISEEEGMFKALSKTVELLEGSASLISQFYYGCLFHELLAFQLADRHPPSKRECVKGDCIGMIGFCNSAMSVLNNAELNMMEEDNSSLVHMDVDQSFLPIPSPVKAAIFESFARQNITESEIDLTPVLKRFIHVNYGFPTDTNTEFVYADRSLPLFNKLVLCCIQEGGTFCFPAGGSNGNYVLAARFLNANIHIVGTKPHEGFKLTEEILEGVFETVKKPWLYVSGPTINPSGLVYGKEEIEMILRVSEKFGVRVVIDTSFSGLEFEMNGGWDLGRWVGGFEGSRFCVALLGGLSLKMQTGGLTFGFLALNGNVLSDSFLYSFPGLSEPHATVKYAIKKLLDMWELKLERSLDDSIAEQKKVLRGRANRLKETLEKCGWDVIGGMEGGISIIAKPSAYLGSKKRDIEVNEWNMRNAILSSTGLCINGSSWTGVPSYFRLTIASEDTQFERALDCILKFNNMLFLTH